MANRRVKYPLTEEAKIWANILVKAWDGGDIDQYLEFDFTYTSGSDVFEASPVMGITKSFDTPKNSILLELSQYNLITLTITPNQYGFRYRVLLMQELRNAETNDFEVSDYFLTFNAVGTIIQGDATISAPFQSSASIFGNVSQTMTPSAIADKLVDILGSDFLQSNKDIAEAIHELKNAVEGERQSKVGKVIMQLGNSFGHVANAYAVVQALGFLAQILR